MGGLLATQGPQSCWVEAVGSLIGRLERWFPPSGLGTSCPAHVGPRPGGASELAADGAV